MKLLKYFIFLIILITSLEAKNYFKEFEKFEKVENLKTVSEILKEVKKKYKTAPNDKIKVKASGEVKWSLINENCEIDPDLSFKDSLDKIIANLEEILKQIQGNIKILLLRESYSQACELIAKEVCLINNSMMQYIDYNQIANEVTSCIGKKIQNIKYNNKGNNHGPTVWLGCDVSPGSGVAPGLSPTFPFCANPTVYFIKCPEGVPKCTPYAIPPSTVDTDFKYDPKTLNEFRKCNNIVYSKHMESAYTRCKQITRKKCVDFFKGRASGLLENDIFNFKLQEQKCILNKNFVDKSLKELLRKEAEGKRLPNNQIVKNGKIVKDESTEEKKEDSKNYYSFYPNKKQNKYLYYKTVSYAKNKVQNFYEKYRTGDYLKDKLLEEKIKQLIKDLEKLNKIPEDNFKERDDFIYKQLEETYKNFDKTPKFYKMKFEIYKFYVEERNELLLKKYKEYRKFDLGFWTEYRSQFKDIWKKIQNDLEDYDEAFLIAYHKFDKLISLIEQKIIDYSKIKKKNINNKNFITE